MVGLEDHLTAIIYSAVNYSPALLPCHWHACRGPLPSQCFHQWYPGWSSVDSSGSPLSVVFTTRDYALKAASSRAGRVWYTQGPELLESCY
jgi:hypothetical protein